MSEPNAASVKVRVLRIVKAINEAVVRREGFDGLIPFFHEAAAIATPGLTAWVRGRDPCLKYYADACSQMTVRTLDVSGEQIDVFGSMAVLSYRYDCVWEFQGRTFTDDGREIVVFLRDGQDWKIAWRTMIPGSRRIQTGQAEREPGPDREAVTPSGVEESVRAVCLNLMTTLPTCQLTTIDADGFPHTTAMNNLRCTSEYPSLTELYEGRNNEFLLDLSTSMQSDKMARIRANPRVSVYFCVPGQFIGLMLGGAIEVVADQALKNRIWQQGWTLYYPNGPEGPEYGVLRLVPTVARGWLQGRPFEFKLSGK